MLIGLTNRHKKYNFFAQLTPINTDEVVAKNIDIG